MYNIKKMAAVAVLALGTSTAFAAGEFDKDKVYVGGGLGYNSLDTNINVDSAIGYQFFGGYDLDFKLGEAGTAIEVGYMNSGDFEPNDSVCDSAFVQCASDDVAGLWATGVADYAIDDKLYVLGRLGLDFGDDDGLMFGFGAGYDLGDQLEIRGEYVMRDNVDSLQGNIVYRLK